MHYGVLAQMVEHLTFNQGVAGSIPACLSKIKALQTLDISGLQGFFFLWLTLSRFYCIIIVESETVTMQISSRLSIALHMFACMEYFKNDRKITSEFLASSVGVNPVIIRKITSQLRDAGLVNVARGTGGVTIAKAPEDITLLDVFNAVDSIENGKLFSFHENPNVECPVGRNIHLILDDKLKSVQDAMEKEMAAITVADVIKDTEKYAAGTAKDK